MDMTNRNSQIETSASYRKAETLPDRWAVMKTVSANPTQQRSASAVSVGGGEGREPPQR